MPQPDTQKPQPVKTLIVWEDLWYAARWWLVNEYVASFEVFEINGVGCAQIANDGVSTPYGTKGCPPGISLDKRNAVDSQEQANDLDDAEVYVAGDIKWDGCSNINFPSTETCMTHLCGYGAWMRYAEMMLRVFREVATKIPRLDRECAGFKDDEKC